MKKIVLLLSLLMQFASSNAQLSGSISIDVGIELEVTADQGLDFIVGETATYSISVINRSFSTAQQIVVTDLLPNSVQFLTDNCGGVIVGKEWSWLLGESLSQNETSTCLIKVMILQSGNIDNSVEVATNDPGTNDPDLSNNFASIDFIASNGVIETDLAISQTINTFVGEVFFQNEQAILNINVINNGPNEVEQFEVVANLSAGLTFIKSNCGVEEAFNTLTWRVNETLNIGTVQACEVIFLLADVGDASVNSVVSLTDPNVDENDLTNNVVISTIEIAALPVGDATTVPTLGEGMKWLMLFLLLLFGSRAIKQIP